MKVLTIHIILIFCFVQIAYSQAEDGVVAFDIPARNSLMFNRYVANPTFSFVREQSKYITVTNKRELVAVEDAPLTYLFNYSGRIKENIGAGIGVYQQNYGVLTTFGGILNFAYNARIQEDSNFTFGINVGAYKSSLNTGKVVTNFDDPALDQIPSNFLLTINPGLNYGTGFMDFGVSYNNIVTYNFNASALVAENPKQGLQGHMMYTGYFGGYGFFGESRFSALARSEFQKDATIISGVVMLTVPKGIWVQGGYNTMYGASGGIGLNITPQIAIEYNYEKPFAGLTNLGAAHEITLAYRFKNKDYFKYSQDDELAGLFSTEKKIQKKKKVIAKTPTEPSAEEQARIASEEKARLASEEQARLVLNEKTRLAAEEQARLVSEEKARLAAEEQARLAAVEQARLAAEEQTRVAAEEQARLAAEEQTRLAAQEQARLAAEELARLAAEEQTRVATEEQVRLAAEEQTRLAAEVQANERLIKTPTDNIGKSISQLTEQTENSSKAQEEFLDKLETAVAIKEKDLKELKEENDLSDQNIYVAPKPFKSVSQENEEIELLKIQLDTVLLRQRKKIKQLESLLKERVATINNPNDELNLYYLDKIANLKTLQDKALRSRESLVSSLKQISIATDFERKRRIKRAAFNNDQDRYSQDRIRLTNLRENIAISETPLTKDDFDFGKERSSNIQILKKVKNTESGYYLVLATHSDVNKRDEFLIQVISSGYSEVDFFYDVSTSEYYIYSKKFNSIQEAEIALRTNKNKPYNEKVTLIKIEN